MTGTGTLFETLRRKGIEDGPVLRAVTSFDRRAFLPPEQHPRADEDVALPIGEAQTLSQPYVVALMTEALDVRPGQRVLEIGTGSGYQAAVLAQLGVEIYSVEIIPPLAERAARTLARLGLSGVHLAVGDGALGWPEAAPFDGVILTAAPAEVPRVLLDQVRPGGTLVAPVGADAENQMLVRWRKPLDGGEATAENLLSVRFVPMTGRVARVPSARELG